MKFDKFYYAWALTALATILVLAFGIHRINARRSERIRELARSLAPKPAPVAPAEAPKGPVCPVCKQPLPADFDPMKQDCPVCDERARTD
ncbi:MAG: hypothetical protein ABFE07_28430 [Armatimonadia bacterium]